ncbi:MAG: NB-ARC domain-containing protein [Anaerolineales bacterium]
MKNVSIGGDVTNSVMVFGNNNHVIKIGDVNGGIVNIIQPSNQPKFSARSAPVMLRPRPFPSLLDRENELDLIKKAVATSAPVSIWGQQGIGKTSFVRQLTHLLDASNFPNGIIHLSASHLGTEDLLQAIFDSLFESQTTYKPTTTEIRHALKDIKALIFLDDLSINQDDVLSMMDAAPNSLFILSGVERSLWGEGEIISLRGLPEAEALKLFEKELSRPLNEQEKEMTAQICTLLQGHPLHILQMAALARETGRPLVSILRDVKSEPVSEKSATTISMANLGNPEKKLLALLSAAGGNILVAGTRQKNIP